MLLVLAVAAALFWLEGGWSVAVVAAAGAVEIGEVAFWIWLSKRRRPAVGAESLPGSVGVVVAPCEPSGQVRVAGELWRAVCPEGAGVGERVVVERLQRDLTLIVRREAPEG